MHTWILHSRLGRQLLELQLNPRLVRVSRFSGAGYQILMALRPRGPSSHNAQRCADIKTVMSPKHGRASAACRLTIPWFNPSHPSYGCPDTTKTDQLVPIVWVCSQPNGNDNDNRKISHDRWGSLVPAGTLLVTVLSSSRCIQPDATRGAQLHLQAAQLCALHNQMRASSSPY